MKTRIFLDQHIDSRKENRETNSLSIESVSNTFHYWYLIDAHIANMRNDFGCEWSCFRYNPCSVGNKNCDATFFFLEDAENLLLIGNVNPNLLKNLVESTTFIWTVREVQKNISLVEKKGSKISLRKHWIHFLIDQFLSCTNKIFIQMSLPASLVVATVFSISELFHYNVHTFNSAASVSFEHWRLITPEKKLKILATVFIHRLKAKRNCFDCSRNSCNFL